jgi:S1-C subfamily serine protease
MNKKHKIIFGSFGIFVILFMIAVSIFGYFAYQKLNSNYLELTGKISETQNQLNELEDTLEIVNSNITSINSNISNIENSSDFSNLVEKAMESVLIIRGYSSDNLEFRSKDSEEDVVGTGFFIYEDYFITNSHVLSEIYISSVNVTANDGKNYSVSRIGGNSAMDITLLKINNSGDFYPPLNLENSDNVKIGEKVIAIGNPYGLEFSVTSGIISALNKKIENYPGEYIQTDAALNPGNSGGPLINEEGKIIGINNYKIFLSEGLGFALESNDIRTTVNEISLKELGYKLI